MTRYEFADLSLDLDENFDKVRVRAKSLFSDTPHRNVVLCICGK